jgi:hypothetical protein
LAETKDRKALVPLSALLLVELPPIGGHSIMGHNAHEAVFPCLAAHEPLPPEFTAEAVRLGGSGDLSLPVLAENREVVDQPNRNSVPISVEVTFRSQVSVASCAYLLTNCSCVTRLLRMPPSLGR